MHDNAVGDLQNPVEIVPGSPSLRSRLVPGLRYSSCTRELHPKSGARSDGVVDLSVLICARGPLLPVTQALSVCKSIQMGLSRM